MSTMGTDEDAVESEPASEAVTRANGDGSVLDSRDGLAFDVGLTSDDAELVEPERSGAIRPEDEDAGLQEPQEHGHVGQVATDRAPGLVEPDETVAPYEFADEEPDPLVTPPEMSQMVFVDVVLLLRRRTRSSSFRRQMHPSASCGSPSVGLRASPSATRRGGSRPRGRSRTNCSLMSRGVRDDTRRGPDHRSPR